MKPYEKELKLNNFLKKYKATIKESYTPENKYYLFLNTSYMNKTKKQKESYKSIADLILTNADYREFISYGVECKLSPKEYVMVYYLLENHSFNNKNFGQVQFKTHKKVKVRKKLRIKKGHSFYKKGEKQIFIIKDYEKSKKIIKKARAHKLIPMLLKKQEIITNGFSSKKSEITSTKNKIKKKIQNQMKKQNIEIPYFEDKFTFFMKAINYNYDLCYPNEYTTVITSYRGRIKIRPVGVQYTN